jgi:type VI protein secretion system component Hcp
VKPIAVDSPNLALVCSSGEFLQEVTVDFVQPRGSQLYLIYRIILHNVRIQSVVSGSEFIGDSLKETIRLFADKVEWVWQKYSERGTPAGQVSGCWDYPANQACSNGG